MVGMLFCFLIQMAILGFCVLSGSALPRNSSSDLWGQLEKLMKPCGSLSQGRKSWHKWELCSVWFSGELKQTRDGNMLPQLLLPASNVRARCWQHADPQGKPPRDTVTLLPRCFHGLSTDFQTARSLKPTWPLCEVGWVGYVRPTAALLSPPPSTSVGAPVWEQTRDSRSFSAPSS